jgi:antirestriction protein ArdC
MKKNTAPKSAAKTSNRPDVYQIVTDRIVEALEGGRIPWKKPWNAQYGAPRNYVTGRAYSGVNAFLLHIACDGVPLFLTFQQAKALGGSIRAGAKGFPVIYYNTVPKKSATEGAEPETVAFLKYYTVFNVADVVGVEIKLPEAAAPVQVGTVEQAEQLVRDWAGKPKIMHAGGEAFYAPALDYVRLPLRDAFTTKEGYYATLFHELVHATGHASRLNRPDLVDSLKFGSEGYAREELTAEMGAAFLCAHVGLDPAVTLTNAAAYIQGWLTRLRNDKQLVVKAAAKAQRAAELIIGTGPQEPGPDEETGPEAPGPQPAPTGAAVQAPQPQERPFLAFTREYESLRAQHPEALLLVRVGDVYEAFQGDAVRLGEVLGVPVTHSPFFPLWKWAGFAAAELDRYLPALVQGGHKVAICEQMQTPPPAERWW